MKTIKTIGIYIFGIITGLCVTITILQHRLVIDIIKDVDWKYVLPVLSLFVGALIPIYITYKTIKAQEIVKLKSELVRSNLDIINQFKTLILLMRFNITHDKTAQDMNSNFALDDIDKSAHELRGPYVLYTHKEFDEFNCRYQILAEGVRRFRNKAIDDYIYFMSTYILNLMLIVNKIPIDNLWELSLIIKKDLFDISNEIEDLLNNYLDDKLFKLNLKGERRGKDVEKSDIESKINNTNLVKFKSEINKLY